MPQFRNPVVAKRSWNEWYFWLALVPYLALCIYLYFAYVEPWTAGRIATRIGADSDRYWDAVQNAQTPQQFAMLMATNFRGPVIIGSILHNGVAVMLLNLMLFAVALTIVKTIPGLSFGTFGLLLLLNAELIPSLTTLNKEILVLLTSVMISKYLCMERRSRLLLASILLISCLARWEAAAFLVLSLLIMRLIKRRRVVALVLLIVGISIAYPLLTRLLGIDESVYGYLLEGANTIVTLDKIQDHFGFALVVAPKIFMSMGGMVVSPSFYLANTGLADGFVDPQEEIFQPIGCYVMMIIFFMAWRKGRLRLDSPAAMVIMTTLIMEAATPFIQPRYLYGVYVMLCIELARRDHLCLPQQHIAASLPSVKRAVSTA